MRKTIHWNDDWEFTRQFDMAFLAGTGPAGERVRLPHSCVEMPYHYFDESIYQMYCGYRKELTVPEEWKGKRILLRVGAAAHTAHVYCNDRKLASHYNGYTAFCADLTDALHQGAGNRIVIAVDSRENQNIPPFGHVIDYMTYGGIYREVSLEIREPVGIADVFCIPHFSRQTMLYGREEAPALLRSEIRLHLGSLQAGEGKGPGSRPFSESLRLRQTLHPLAGGKEAESGLLLEDIPLTKCRTRLREDLDGSKRVFVLEKETGPVRVWDVKHPWRYRVRTELWQGDLLLDATEECIGFRRTFFGEEGFYLNDRKLRLVGLNRHQSYPYTGYAMPQTMQEMDADILKFQLGLNAVRTSHYPQSQHFINRCDEIGLLVFTEMPGWQHIGNAAWKRQAVRNVQEMVTQYRNHPSIILWGVRINESVDDSTFYIQTGELAKQLDGSRATGGVRCHKNSELYEDVYTYNDFSYDGTTAGCEKKNRVTPDPSKAYLISEYNGHMFPTKMFDSEAHRTEHALRHATVLNAIASQKDIAGGFGWCMADYNTHQDFGSGDRICYHGVLDMFRNPKPAAYAYAANGSREPVLFISSAMDIGEQPTGNPGHVWIFTNAQSVRMYKNDRLIKVFTPGKTADSKRFAHLKHPPMEIDEYIGDAIKKGEQFAPEQERLVREFLNYAARYGFSRLPARMLAKGGILMTRYHMKYDDAYRLYSTYVGDWGGTATSYRFEAVSGGKVVKTVIKAPVKDIRLQALVYGSRPGKAGRIWQEEADYASRPILLREAASYDVAAIRLNMCDQNGNSLPFYQGLVRVETEGPIEVIGPGQVILRGGSGGTYVKSCGREGLASLSIRTERGQEIRLPFRISRLV